MIVVIRGLESTHENIVEEEERHRSRSNLLLGSEIWLRVEGKQDRDHEVAEELARSCVHHHFSSTPAFNIRDTNKGEQKIGDGIASCQKTG